MKKSKLKIAIKNAMKAYYKLGLTNTAHSVQAMILESVDKEYNKKHK